MTSIQNVQTLHRENIKNIHPCVNVCICYKDTTEVMYSTLIIKCKNKERVAYTPEGYSSCTFLKNSSLYKYIRT